MHLKDYFPTLSPKERIELAVKVRVSVGHLRNAVYGAPISHLVVARLEHHTQGKIRRIDHFPHNYAEFWPELAGSEEPSIVANETASGGGESALAHEVSPCR